MSQHMIQYVLNIVQPDGPPPADLDMGRIMKDVEAFITDVRAKNVWVFNGGLTPPSAATVVRTKNGETLLSDGPFAEGKEHVGGFVIVRARDLDEAVRWAAQLSRATTLPVEVRAFAGH